MTDDEDTLSIDGTELEQGDKIQHSKNGGEAIYEFTGDITDGEGIFTGQNRRALTVAQFTQGWLSSREVAFADGYTPNNEGSSDESNQSDNGEDTNDKDDMTPKEALEELFSGEGEPDNEKIQQTLEEYNGMIPGVPQVPQGDE